MTRYHRRGQNRVPFTAEEEAARDAEEQALRDTELDRTLNQLRKERNQLLTESDWVVVKAKETDAVIPAEWKTYRQELRDLTNGLTTVEQVRSIIDVENFGGYPTKP